MLRTSFITLLKREGIPCKELHVPGYRGTLWEVNKKCCFITYETNDLWYQVPENVLNDAYEIIFLTMDPSGRPKPYLISTEDFCLTVSGVRPVDGSYNVNIKGTYPHIECRISFGDRTIQASSVPNAGMNNHPEMPLVFHTFECLYLGEDDEAEVTKAFRRLEEELGNP